MPHKLMATWNASPINTIDLKNLSLLYGILYYTRYTPLHNGSGLQVATTA